MRAYFSYEIKSYLWIQMFILPVAFRFLLFFAFPQTELNDRQPVGKKKGKIIFICLVEMFCRVEWDGNGLFLGSAKSEGGELDWPCLNHFAQSCSGTHFIRASSWGQGVRYVRSSVIQIDQASLFPLSISLLMDRARVMLLQPPDEMTDG